MSRVYNQAAATILSASSLSAAISVGAGVITALIMPASWTAADITFQASIDGVNFFDLYDSYGTEVTAKVAASRYVSTEAASFAGLSFLKLRSGTGSLAVAQAGDRVIQIIGRKERGKQ